MFTSISPLQETIIKETLNINKFVIKKKLFFYFISSDYNTIKYVQQFYRFLIKKNIFWNK